MGAPSPVGLGMYPMGMYLPQHLGQAGQNGMPEAAEWHAYHHGYMVPMYPPFNQMLMYAGPYDPASSQGVRVPNFEAKQ